jgi:hypothetical protein
MSLSAAAVAREAGVSALVNMSQMTVSEMSIQNTTPSHRQRQRRSKRAGVPNFLFADQLPGMREAAPAPSGNGLANDSAAMRET